MGVQWFFFVNLIFKWPVTWSISNVLVGYHISSSLKHLAQFLPIYHWVLCFLSSSYKIQVLRYMTLQYFYQSVNYLFYFFKKKLFLHFNEVQFINFSSFIVYAFCIIPKKSLVKPRTQRQKDFPHFCPEVLSFQVLHLGLWFITIQFVNDIK